MRPPISPAPVMPATITPTAPMTPPTSMIQASTLNKPATKRNVRNLVSMNPPSRQIATNCSVRLQRPGL